MAGCKHRCPSSWGRTGRGKTLSWQRGWDTNGWKGSETWDRVGSGAAKGTRPPAGHVPGPSLSYLPAPPLPGHLPGHNLNPLHLRYSQLITETDRESFLLLKTVTCKPPPLQRGSRTPAGPLSPGNGFRIKCQKQMGQQFARKHDLLPNLESLLLLSPSDSFSPLCSACQPHAVCLQNVKIHLWRRKWQPTPVFLPGASHGQRSLAGYSPRGHKELNMTRQLNSNNNVQLHALAPEMLVRLPHLSHQIGLRL